MTVTQARAIEVVRDRLDEATAANWTDNQLRQWINEAVRDLARVTETVQKQQSITVTSGNVSAGDTEYLLANDVLRVFRVEYTATGDTRSTPLEFREFQTLDSIAWSGGTSGRPQIFSFWGFSPTLKLVVYPAPSLPGTLDIWYYGVPADLVTSATTDAAVVLSVPNGWEDLVYMYVEYLALRRDRDPRWQEAKALYDERLGDMLNLTRRWTDQAGAVSPTGGVYPAWLVEG